MFVNGTYHETFETCDCCGFEFGVSEHRGLNHGYVRLPAKFIEAAFQLYRKKWIDEEECQLFAPQNIPAAIQENGAIKLEVLIAQFKNLGLDVSKFGIDALEDVTIPEEEDEKGIYPCPICGFEGLTNPVFEDGEYKATFDICGCCGFEFGFSEDHEIEHGYVCLPDEYIEMGFQMYRKKWIDEMKRKIFAPQDVPVEWQKRGALKIEVVIRRLEKLGIDLENCAIEAVQQYLKHNG